MATGWERQSEFRASPYDWRMNPYMWELRGGYFRRLKRDVELLKRDSGGKKVALLSFSMGGPVANSFLQVRHSCCRRRRCRCRCRRRCHRRWGDNADASLASWLGWRAFERHYPGASRGLRI